MLILLDSSIVESADKLSNKDLESFEDLLLSHSKLYHYVGAPRRIAVELMKKLGAKLNQRTLQTLDLISNQSSDLQAIIRTTRFHAVVHYSALAGATTHTQGDQTIWRCDINYAAQWFSQPATLIGEHLVDTKMLKVAAADMGGESGIAQRMQRINSEMSGGCGNAWEVLKNRIEAALCPVLCIIDSDKLVPKIELTPPVEKCHGVIKEMKGISAFFEIEQREMENILPETLLQGAISMLPRSADRDEIENKYKILLKIKKNHPKIYRHVDIKEGTCYTWAKNKKVLDFFTPVGVTGKCACHAGCDGLIAPPLFKDVLSKAVAFTDLTNIVQLRKSLTKEERADWLGIGIIVMSFSLANSTRVT